MKYTLSTQILANNTRVIIIMVASRSTPRMGRPSEVTGNHEGMMSKKTVMARRTVVTNPMRSPLSTWIRKLLKARIVRMTHGIVT